MSMIRVENLTFAYPGSYDHVFEHASFQIDTDWRLGFIGRNGRGKTTFLRLLMGQYSCSGAISASVAFRYFPDPVPDPSLPAAAVLRRLRPSAQDWELRRALNGLALSPQALDRPFSTLSNGERTKVLLAALFLDENGYPLIDEPTNHLDADGRAQVAAYLSRQRGFLLVSHDRAFLDGCTDHILSVNRANIEVQSGNFSSWLVNFQRQQAFELAQNEKLGRDIDRLRRSARETADWSRRAEADKKGKNAAGLKPDRGYVGRKAAKMMQRAKGVEARRERAAEQKASLLKNAEREESVRLTPLRHHATVLASFSEVSVRYGERRVCGPLSFTLSGGERIALEGGNGSGKTSLLKLLLQEPVPHEGTVRTASGLIISYLPQDASRLAGSLSRYARENGIQETLLLTILRKLGFERVQFEKDLSSLSAGQKKKVLLAGSLCRPAHLYVWDEPLNYIDVYSRMQIESLVCDCAPTMLFVEHDGAFRARIATRTLRLS